MRVCVCVICYMLHGYESMFSSWDINTHILKVCELLTHHLLFIQMLWI